MKAPFRGRRWSLPSGARRTSSSRAPDVWLCHQCSDCTAYCPRGAKPGEVLNAIRKQSIKHVAMVPLFAKIATEPKLIWLLFAIPMALLYVVLMILGNTNIDAVRAKSKVMAYHNFMPVPAIDII